nr:MAG: RNA-dependent RNA polymerase [Yellow silver pine associated botourmia-like virus 66]
MRSGVLPQAGGTGKRSPLPTIIHQLQELMGYLSTFTGLTVPCLPSFESVDEVKQFCVGLLDPGCPHPLREWVSGCGPTDRWTVQHSLFLFRKTLPSDTGPSAVLRSYASKMSTPQPAADPEFLSFVDREVPKLFKPGWDRGYRHEVCRLSLSTSSCLENRMGAGGARSLGLGTLRECRLEAAGLAPCDDDHLAHVLAVPDGGKHRVVTVNSVRQHALRPLHHVMYDHLSRKEWLLRGDVSSSRFKDFSFVEGEVFCSGDYEAATDNIPLDVYRHLLKAVGRTSRKVPDSVWSYAYAESQKDLFVDGRLLKQQRGQLMGSYLSFPFLCLLNYLVFKFNVPRHVPVRINGDDIVFRASRGEVKKWMEGVGRCGLTLSKGKTVVDERFFTVNSVPLRSCGWGAKVVPFIRPLCLFNTPDSPSGLKGQYDSMVVGAPGHAAWADLRVGFLNRFRTVVLSTQRSLTRCLGIRVTHTILRRAGLWEREQFYLSLPEERPVPFSKGCWTMSLAAYGSRVPLAPRGFARRAQLTWQSEVFFPTLVLESRLLPFQGTKAVTYDWSLCREHTFRWSPWRKKPGLWRWALKHGRRGRVDLPNVKPSVLVWVPPRGGGEHLFLSRKSHGCGRCPVSWPWNTS